MKFADGELERFETKLFVGQIPKDKGEEDIRQLFSPFGEIETINLLRNGFGGPSKGCCFVKFRTREQADAAIEGLTDFRMETPHPLPTGLVVKFADSDQQRAHRKMHKVSFTFYHSLSL